MTLFVVGIAVVARSCHDVHARRFRHSPQLCGTPAETDRRQLDHGLQAAARRAPHLLDRLVDVVEILAWKGGAAEEEVVVRVRDTELFLRDGAEHRDNLTHERHGPQPWSA